MQRTDYPSIIKDQEQNVNRSGVCSTALIFRSKLECFFFFFFSVLKKAFITSQFVTMAVNIVPVWTLMWTSNVQHISARARYLVYFQIRGMKSKTS